MSFVTTRCSIVLAGKLEAEAFGLCCRWLGKSTLNRHWSDRLRGARPGSITKIDLRCAEPGKHLVRGHLRSMATSVARVKEIVLDTRYWDFTDEHDPRRARRSVRSMATSDSYCYLAAATSSASRFLLGAKLRPANRRRGAPAQAVDAVPCPASIARIRARSSRRVRIVLRGRWSGLLIVEELMDVVRGRAVSLTCSAWRPTRA